MAGIAFFGDIGCGGTYLLRIRVEASSPISFGRFRRGQLLTLPAGDYLYVGSALATRGAAGLPRRLLRHATRTGNRPPHALRDHLLDELRAAGIMGAAPPVHKTLRWHIDYLLDIDVVSLESIYALGDGAAVEQAIAARLVAAPQMWVPAAGLGASDDRRGTHLLGVHGDAAWWQRLALWLGELHA